MGFMGLSSYVESDGASDLVYSILKEIGDRCLNELKDVGNCYNTPGYVNVALYAETFLMKCGEYIYEGDSLYKALVKARTMLTEALKKIKEEDSYPNKRMFVCAYTRMIKNLSKIINKVP